MLRRRLRVGVACEPRHPSWFEDGVDGLWRRHRVARVAADPACCPAAAEPGGDPRWRYWRWHGSPRIYYSDYDNEALRALAVQVQASTTPPERRIVIFDNTAGGHAAGNAARFQDLAGGRHA